MQVDALAIDERIVRVLEAQGIKELYPPQAEALPLALRGDNLVLALPTASGKSLVAYLAILDKVLKGGKAMYIVPLRALASEKYEDFKEFAGLGVHVALSYGDLDAKEPRLGNFDVIIATAEKADSLLRHRAHWLERIDIVVADETHLINDGSRGPTLEIILTRFKRYAAQLIALSATIRNSEELAEWLGAEHIKSSFRPVPLKRGVCSNGRIDYEDYTKTYIARDRNVLRALVTNVTRDEGQCLVFVNTRRSTKSLSAKLSMRHILSQDDIKALKAVANELRGINAPQSVKDDLIAAVSNGVCYHHAGLTNEMRRIIERNFKRGRIKCLVATPTLAAGVNLPARAVIVRDLWRWNALRGRVKIPVLEIHQMMGRAGRPKYDSEGTAILMARKEQDKDELFDNYIYAEPERIESKLGTENALRTHILAAIATGFVHDEEALKRFMADTFAAHQGAISDAVVLDVIEFLEANELIDGFGPTRFGRAVSNLYIDPLSGITLKTALANARSFETFPVLHAICTTVDVIDLYLRRDDYPWVTEKIEHCQEALLIKGEDYDEMLTAAKTASLIEDWIDETDDETLDAKYRIGPGDIYREIEVVKWLCYGMKELAKLFNTDLVSDLDMLMRRVKYGAKAELLPLVTLHGIGRVRARALFGNGFKTPDDLARAAVGDIAKVRTIGEELAKSIKAQLAHETPQR